MDDEVAPAERWRQALRELTATEADAWAWRQDRYTFAYRLGQALVGATDGSPAVVGPVLYGVWLDSGLVYVGQTGEAERRLRDLPVGESHHLANTYPPEIWTRVVVVRWSLLPAAADAVAELGAPTVALALEHLLQEELRPLVNGWRRMNLGGWRRVRWEESRSRGALAAASVAMLFSELRTVWESASHCASVDSDELTPACRVVFPGRLFDTRSA